MLKTKSNVQTKARAYVRVSTLKESQKDSPEHQEGLIRETAASDGIEIEHVYLDTDTATNIIDRDDVQRMVEDAKHGVFNTIYFASLSRFSRDTLDAISLKRILVNALGIRLVSIEDLYDSAKEDNEMIFTIISSVNQKQSETISTSSKRGIRQSAKKGNFTGTIAPYGYKKVTIDGRKALEIVPEDAKIVQKIYDFYVNHSMGEKAITNYLNEELELPSPKGGLWGLSTVQRILQNENYTGFLTFCKMESLKVYEDINDLQNRRKKLVHRDKDLWERTEFPTHDAIIPPELYQKAQQIREWRGGGKRGGRKSFVNVFAKMMFCKDCGAAMVTMNTNPHGKKMYRYLMCSKRRRQGAKGCGNSVWIPYEKTRNEIISKLIEKVSQYIDMLGAKESSDNAASDAEFAERSYEKEIKKMEKFISDNRRLLFEVRRQNMLKEISDDQYNFEREQYEAEIKEAEKKLAALNKKINERKDTEKFLKEFSEAVDLLARMKNYDDVEATRLNLMKIVDRIDVNKDGEVNVHSVLGKI